MTILREIMISLHFNNDVVVFLIFQFYPRIWPLADS